jgi:cell division protein FtsL
MPNSGRGRLPSPAPDRKSVSAKTRYAGQEGKTLLIVISALSLFLVIATAYLIKQTQRTTRAQKSLRAINKRIVSQNNELEKVNLQLKTLIKRSRNLTG